MPCKVSDTERNNLRANPGVALDSFYSFSVGALSGFSHKSDILFTPHRVHSLMPGAIPLLEYTVDSCSNLLPRAEQF